MLHTAVVAAPARRRWPGVLGWIAFVAAVVGAVLVRRQLPWVPVLYLGGLIASGVVAWRMVRWRGGRPWLRWPGLLLALGVLALLCPVPWMKADLDDPPGTAWRLDGWVTVDGETVDPPGAWYWLTAGRPPIVAELVGGWLFDDGSVATDLRTGRATSQPRFSEPAAAAVGLRRAGYGVGWTVYVELSGPTDERFPDHAVVSELNGTAVTSRDVWREAVDSLGRTNSFTTADGASYAFAGTTLPYRRVDVIEMPAEDLDISVGGGLAGTGPGRWFRSLAVGRSHGMMVALVTYAHFSGEDLARGRAIAGTGGINADGSVSSIGGLLAKARAARAAGADVLLFPAQQAGQLAGFDAGSMRLVPVASLDDAIAALRT